MRKHLESQSISNNEKSVIVSNSNYEQVQPQQIETVTDPLKVCVCLYDYITESDLEDEDELDEILMNTKILAATFGSIVSLHYQFDENAEINDKLYVLIVYNSSMDASIACKSLNGMIFSGISIRTKLSTFDSKFDEIEPNNQIESNISETHEIFEKSSNDYNINELKYQLILKIIINNENNSENYQENEEESLEIMNNVMKLCENFGNPLNLWIEKQNFNFNNKIEVLCENNVTIDSPWAIVELSSINIAINIINKLQNIIISENNLNCYFYNYNLYLNNYFNDFYLIDLTNNNELYFIEFYLIKSNLNELILNEIEKQLLTFDFKIQLIHKKINENEKFNEKMNENERYFTTNISFQNAIIIFQYFSKQFIINQTILCLIISNKTQKIIEYELNQSIILIIKGFYNFEDLIEANNSNEEIIALKTDLLQLIQSKKSINTLKKNDFIKSISIYPQNVENNQLIYNKNHKNELNLHNFSQNFNEKSQNVKDKLVVSVLFEEEASVYETMLALDSIVSNGKHLKTEVSMFNSSNLTNKSIILFKNSSNLTNDSNISINQTVNTHKINENIIIQNNNNSKIETNNIEEKIENIEIIKVSKYIQAKSVSRLPRHEKPLNSNIAVSFHTFFIPFLFLCIF